MEVVEVEASSIITLTEEITEVPNHMDMLRNRTRVSNLRMLLEHTLLQHLHMVPSSLNGQLTVKHLMNMHPHHSLLLTITQTLLRNITLPHNIPSSQHMASKHILLIINRRRHHLVKPSGHHQDKQHLPVAAIILVRQQLQEGDMIGIDSPLVVAIGSHTPKTLAQTSTLLHPIPTLVLPLLPPRRAMTLIITECVVVAEAEAEVEAEIAAEEGEEVVEAIMAIVRMPLNRTTTINPMLLPLPLPQTHRSRHPHLRQRRRSARSIPWA